MTKRIFLACQIPDSVKIEIVNIENRLKEAKFALKLTPKEQLHITLAFLPRVEPAQLPQISAVVKKTCSQFAKFGLTLGNLDAFPNLKLPRIVYVTLTGETSTLSNLARLIQYQIETLGFEFNHEKFLPHITIARTKSYVNKVERRKLGETIQRWGKISPAEIVVEAVSIFESIPMSAGHVHKLLEEIELAKNQ